MKRQIIKIDEEKCNGCGECIKGCPEGALQLIDGKARLINEAFCDGLGACIGDCPLDAITIEEREAKAYDERIVVDRMIEQGENVLKAHLKHLKEHGQEDLLQEALECLKEKGIEIDLEEEQTPVPTACGCPSAVPAQWEGEETSSIEVGRIPSKLRQWPVQLYLVPIQAPYFKDANLVIAADCVPFAYANFHQDFLDGNSLIVGCPKLDDAGYYIEKLTEIFKQNDLKKVTIAHMEVPCCFGLNQIVKQAVTDSGKEIPIEEITISIKGEKLIDDIKRIKVHN
ncbi:MAG: 4Fe-4S dicluster domain-containing protein [Candidatus Stahlbacteria bacterium]|nr:MAG: 4Fe-4S dicluster domain-containing protein [Candidatus Stahlbacteria bacterium]